MPSLSRARLCCLLLAMVFVPSLVRAQNYTKLVVFGDSLSDTGNVANLFQQSYGIRYPSGSFNYADGRFTDDANTSPPATSYFGVWVEQLATPCAAPLTVLDSLDGGTNYAYADATTANGSTTVSGGLGLSVTVANMGQQVTNYLASAPALNAATLYVVFGGANDLFADSSMANATAAAQREAALVQRLIAAGATNFIVPNLPPLGNTPFYYGGSSAATLNTASAQFRTALAAALQSVIVTATGNGISVRILQPDLYTLFAGVEQNPAQYGFINVTAAAQGITAATADNYLFWDTIHPTIAGHRLIAQAATGALSGQSENIFSANSGGNVSSFGNSGAQQSTPTAGGGKGAAVGTCGSVWSINNNGTGVSKFTDAGAFTASYSGAGISAATALAIDGLGAVWIANGNGTVSALTSAGTPVSATPVAAAGNLSQPTSLTIDTAGSLWIANQGNNTVTEVLGAAAPVVTPLVSTVATATPAQRP